MVDKDTFLTNQKKEYKWPYLKPLVAKPAQPPMRTKPNNFYVAKLVEPYCHCDAHLYDPQMTRYKKLADKEKLLHDELGEVNDQMAELANSILDHPCDSYDTKMESIYQTDYIKRGLNLTQYRALMPAVESPVGVPVKSQSIGLEKGYRDPTMFRYRCLSRPTIHPCPPVTFATTPGIIEDWFTPRTGQSEYEDTISKTGLMIVKNRQQYAEPLPSSRRRYYDPCL